YIGRTVDHEFAIGQSLQAHQLVEAYEKGELKGKLNEIAAQLEEESNPVIILAKHK
ncbi:MAG: 6-bladed beta-propeller, partial [Tannerellaceae bacterium]